jgi:hypothetical protein
MKCIWCRQQFHSFFLIFESNQSRQWLQHQYEHISHMETQGDCFSLLPHLSLWLLFTLVWFSIYGFWSVFLPTLYPFFFHLKQSSHSTSQESFFQAWHTLICVFEGSPGKVFWFTKFHYLIFLVHLGSIAHHICQLNT